MLIEYLLCKIAPRRTQVAHKLLPLSGNYQFNKVYVTHTYIIMSVAIRTRGSYAFNVGARKTKLHLYSY